MTATEAKGATRALGAWIADAPARWSAEARRRAAGAFVDTVACALAGAGDEATRHVTLGISRWRAEPSVSVFGGTARLAAPWAALVNGTAAHALDYDDILKPANAHASAAIVPAVLALGEEIGAGGAACLDAYIVGIEVCGLVGEAMNMSHYQRGWHATSTIGSVGCAAAGARLLGLDENRASAALALSTSLASGSKRQFGTMAKPMHAGLAAQNGILAASLAQAGTTAAEEAFDGPWGLHDLMAGNPETGFAKAVAAVGGTPVIERYGLWQKPYPCCGSNHQAVAGLLELKAREGFSAEAVDEIRIELPEMYHRNLQFRAARDPMEARFCLEYCVASALLDGALGLGAFSPEAILRPALAPFMQRVVRLPRPDPNPADLPLPVAVEVRLRDGRRMSIDVTDAAQLDHDALSAKFDECAFDVLGEEAARTAREKLFAIGSQADLRELVIDLTPTAHEHADLSWRRSRSPVL